MTGVRKFGLGQVALHLWYNPVSRLRDSLRNGGPWVERETERQRKEMEVAAASLPPLPKGADTTLTLHLLTGRRFWYQTAFCLHSFARHAAGQIKAEIYDDGSLDEETCTHLTRLGARVHPFSKTLENLEQHLPVARFPVLRERWQNYPNLRKLIDPHLGSRGWKLVIDSDLLFFRRPDFLRAWLAAPTGILHAIDCEESYGYSRALLTQLAGAPLPPRVNVGLCGMQSESLDWAELEYWCATLIARERTNYYLEQALVAMLAARTPNRAIAPEADYVTRPAKGEVLRPRAIMHHYVAESKRWYFRHGWRHLVR